jgi:hypothetical protein
VSAARAIKNNHLHESVVLLVALQGGVLLSVDFIVGTSFKRNLVFRTATFLKASPFSLAGERTKARWAVGARLG